MAEQFHYPPEVLNLLVDTIPLLCRSKKDVVLFLQGSGVDPSDLADVSRTVRTAPESINKYEITRTVLAKVNARGDSGLRPRCEIIKRVVEFEDYSTCWPNDQLKAKGWHRTVDTQARWRGHQTPATCPSCKRPHATSSRVGKSVPRSSQLAGPRQICGDVMIYENVNRCDRRHTSLDRGS